jgi:release factor glutamine methyltransferase
VLIPRPETECLVEAVLPLLESASDGPMRVLDMGTGSGAIVIALAYEHPRHRYLGTDRSSEALHVARSNARRHGVDGCIDWFCGDWDAPLAPRGPAFHLIVSNPPYIRRDDIDALQPEIRQFEPHGALNGSDDGLASLVRILESAYRHLAGGGTLALEMGHDQAADVRAAARRTGRYTPVRIIRDYAGQDRVAVMEKIAVSS